MEKLTTNERLRRLFKGDKIDRIPIIPSASLYAGNLAKVTSREYFLNYEKSFEIKKIAAEIFGYDENPEFNLPGYISWDFGGELHISNKFNIVEPQIIEYPVSDKNDLDNLFLPDLDEAPGFQNRLNFHRIARKNDLSVSIFAGSPLEVVGNIVDINTLIKWFYKKPEIVHSLLKLGVEYILESADYYIDEFGVENCIAFSAYPLESNTIMSEKMFKKFCLPYIMEIFEKLIQKQIKSFGIHLCGDHRLNLKYFKNLPLPDRSFISVSEKMDIELVAQMFGDKHIIGGNIPTSLLINGTANEVYNKSTAIINKMKNYAGGFALMPSCNLPPVTPPLNLYAMIKAVKENGIIR
ncbi:uroporphyrinogen decarboxylase family protein [Acetohalobium arabaticum]|uniref:Uroporphyrinogen-III decarboxylase n=1 Tax=Acetohalobium arabaticum (strain ATCC 49924 / DSM 5501 / Z-7288) TaxID=574087 RepID=D9QVB7_ACEAZ|nr:uroporphyrinogen decarboxylase family protein [Acetohalobium arabaticum]ADL12176.1 Uroporphyrinogen-III decarboxylase [Acetohalobium arabaticum DSM 5501]